VWPSRCLTEGGIGEARHDARRCNRAGEVTLVPMHTGALFNQRLKKKLAAGLYVWN
jgi:hypothetical protein